MPKTSDLDNAMATIHRMSVFIETHHPGFDMAKEANNFYTNAEGDLVYIPPQGNAGAATTEEGSGVVAAPAEPPAEEPQPQPKPQPQVEAQPAPEAKPNPQPKPSPKTEAQKVLASGTQTTQTEGKLDASKMGIQSYLSNVDQLVAQSKEKK